MPIPSFPFGELQREVKRALELRNWRYVNKEDKEGPNDPFGGIVEAILNNGGLRHLVLSNDPLDNHATRDVVRDEHLIPYFEGPRLRALVQGLPMLEDFEFALVRNQVSICLLRVSLSPTSSLKYLVMMLTPSL